MKFGTALVATAAAKSSYHARSSKDPFWEISGVTDLALLDFVDGFIQIKFSKSDALRFDACYENIPKIVREGMSIAEDIDWP